MSSLTAESGSGRACSPASTPSKVAVAVKHPGVFMETSEMERETGIAHLPKGLSADRGRAKDQEVEIAASERDESAGLGGECRSGSASSSISSSDSKSKAKSKSRSSSPPVAKGIVAAAEADAETGTAEHVDQDEPQQPAPRTTRSRVQKAKKETNNSQDRQCDDTSAQGASDRLAPAMDDSESEEAHSLASEEDDGGSVASSTTRSSSRAAKKPGSAKRSAPAPDDDDSSNGNGARRIKTRNGGVKSGGRGGGHHPQGARGRRWIFKKSATRAPAAVAKTVTSERIYYKGQFYTRGDIVSVTDVDGGIYYAQFRGFLTDQYCEKSGVITWLLPTTLSPPPEEGFDPATYVLGPEEELPRRLEFFTFVMHAPDDYFHQRNAPYPTINQPSDQEYLVTRTGPKVRLLKQGRTVYQDAL